ncbi:MAG: starvation-inducible DNA-binding protein [Candidatus Pelagisphaera sp.]|jgi:starvation-inducible DNA-binding protein
MNTKQPLQTIDEIERNPIGLPTISAKEVSDQLDPLVSSMSVQFHQYLKHHWLVEGPGHRDLHVFFEESYESMKDSLDTIAERMTTLGAIPISTLRGQSGLSFIESEQEGALPIRQMLEADLKNEQALIDEIRKAIETASELSDYGTETILKGILHAREDQAHEIEHYLSSDSLVRNTLESSLT